MNIKACGIMKAPKKIEYVAILSSNKEDMAMEVDGQLHGAVSAIKDNEHHDYADASAGQKRKANLPPISDLQASKKCATIKPAPSTGVLSNLKGKQCAMESPEKHGKTQIFKSMEFIECSEDKDEFLDFLMVRPTQSVHDGSTYSDHKLLAIHNCSSVNSLLIV